jgi:hypothetical protein
VWYRQWFSVLNCQYLTFQWLQVLNKVHAREWVSWLPSYSRVPWNELRTIVRFGKQINEKKEMEKQREESEREREREREDTTRFLIKRVSESNAIYKNVFCKKSCIFSQLNSWPVTMLWLSLMRELRNLLPTLRREAHQLKNKQIRRQAKNQKTILQKIKKRKNFSYYLLEKQSFVQNSTYGRISKRRGKI